MVNRPFNMLHMEIHTPSWRQTRFNEEENKVGLKCVANLIDDLKEVVHVREFVAKHRAARRYNSKVKPREMQEVDMVL